MESTAFSSLPAVVVSSSKPQVLVLHSHILSYRFKLVYEIWTTVAATTSQTHCIALIYMYESEGLCC